MVKTRVRAGWPSSHSTAPRERTSREWPRGRNSAAPDVQFDRGDRNVAERTRRIREPPRQSGALC